MKQENHRLRGLLAIVGTATVIAVSGTSAMAKAPCGELGECKALVEINSSDGDIGFHFLMDGDDLIEAKVKRPDGSTVFQAGARRELRYQKMTEIFVESAEPLCFDPLTDEDPDNDDEDFVTLDDFLARWDKGEYKFIGVTEDASSYNQTKLRFNLPAAPANLSFDPLTGIISWDAGTDLGACATTAELDDLVTAGDLPKHPQNVVVAAWEVVLLPDVDDGDPLAALEFSVRVPGDIAVTEIEVPASYLAALPDDILMKGEVGAIGVGDNATFTEFQGVCVNEVLGCQ